VVFRKQADMPGISQDLNDVNRVLSFMISFTELRGHDAKRKVCMAAPTSHTMCKKQNEALHEEIT